MHRVSHSPSSTATGLPDAKEDVYNTASALTTDDASPVEPSDNTAVLLQPQLTSTELPSTVAVAAQGDSSNHASVPLRQQATTAVSSSIDQGDAVPAVELIPMGQDTWEDRSFTVGFDSNCTILF